jgi:hypothetical protein
LLQGIPERTRMFVVVVCVSSWDRRAQAFLTSCDENRKPKKSNNADSHAAV